MENIHESFEERCGIIYEGKFIELDNIAENKTDNFEFDFDFNSLEWGKLESIVHSHIDGTNYLSSNDRKSQVKTGKHWTLVTKDGVFKFNCVPHLRGRKFEYGVNDCATLIEDAYHLAGINLKKLERKGIEEDNSSEKLLRSLPKLGFHQIKPEDIAPGDVICTNAEGLHLMLYIGEERILHHAYEQYSKTQLYSSVIIKMTHSVWRHKDWEGAKINAILADLETSG